MRVVPLVTMWSNANVHSKKESLLQTEHRPLLCVSKPMHPLKAQPNPNMQNRNETKPDSRKCSERKGNVNQVDCGPKLSDRIWSWQTGWKISKVNMLQNVIHLPLDDCKTAPGKADNPRLHTGDKVIREACGFLCKSLKIYKHATTTKKAFISTHCFTLAIHR